MRVGITVADDHAPVFERHLSQAGYAFERGRHLAEGVGLLLVRTDNAEALRAVVQAACDECAGGNGVLQ